MMVSCHGRCGRAIAPQVKAGSITRHLGMKRRAVALVERQILPWRRRPGSRTARRPSASVAGKRLGVGVEQQLVVVEAVAGLGLVRAVHPIAVELARAHVGQVAVPDLVGVLGQRDARDLALAGVVEQAQLDLFRVRREQREVGAGTVPGRAQADTADPAKPAPSHPLSLSCPGRIRSVRTAAAPPSTLPPRSGSGALGATADHKAHLGRCCKLPRLPGCGRTRNPTKTPDVPAHTTPDKVLTLAGSDGSPARHRAAGFVALPAALPSLR